jgi:hypothetical protein
MKEETDLLLKKFRATQGAPLDIADEMQVPLTSPFQHITLNIIIL